MKNYIAILGIAIITVCLASCKKSNSESPYFFQAKIDGNWVTFSDAKFMLAADPSDPTVTDLQITAGTEQYNINVLLHSTESYDAGTYNTTDSIPYTMQVALFKDENGYMKIFGTLGPGTGTDPYYVMNITSITSTEVRGTITGNYLYDNYDALSIDFTEGEFVATKTQ